MGTTRPTSNPHLGAKHLGYSPKMTTHSSTLFPRMFSSATLTKLVLVCGCVNLASASVSWQYRPSSGTWTTMNLCLSHAYELKFQEYQKNHSNEEVDVGSGGFDFKVKFHEMTATNKWGDNKCEIRRQELQKPPSAKQLVPITEQWRTHQFGPLQPDEVQRRLNFAFGSANPTKRSPTYKMTVPAEGHFEYYPNGRSTWVTGAPVEKTFYTEWTIGYHIDQAVNRRTPTLTFTQYQVTTGHTYPLILIPPPQVEASLRTKKIFQDTLSSKITEFINENSCTPTPVIYHACGI